MATATALGLEGTLLFHLNLNRGTLEVESRGAVIARCYRPLLELAEQRPWLRLALAASGHTLERIARADPAWIARLRTLLDAGRVELVGTGDTLLIGPLVPAVVNRWNQALGRATYLRLLARAPRIALVNAFAWSQGLLDAYLDAGYEGLITEWNDARRFHPEWQEEWRYRTAWTQSPSGRRIRVLWSEALLSQSLRRALTDEMEPEHYFERVLAHDGEQARHVFLYAGEVEEVDGRPSAVSAPEARERSEWQCLGELCDGLRARGLELTMPGYVLDDARFAPGGTLELSLAANPIALGGDAPCSVVRWALAGWENEGINARCFGRAKELLRVGGSARDWQLLCRAWGADLRGPLTEKRWRRFARSLPAAPAEKPASPAFQDALLRSRRIERAGKRLAVGTDGVRAVLNLHRGLALDELVLRHAGPEPLLGTLPFGTLEGGEHEADAFSGHAQLVLPGEERITDLAAVEPEVEELAHCVRVQARVPTRLGPLPKEVRVYAQRLELRYGFSAWGTRPRGSLRAGALTVLEGALGDELWVSCANGGPRERMRLTQDFDHARADPRHGSSAGAAFGATDGWIAIDDGRIGFEVSWPQEEAAALPLVTFRRVGAKRFVRLWFTLAELDVTQRGGATLHDFRLSIRPYRNRR